MRRRTGVSALVAVLLCCGASVAAQAGGPQRELPKNDFLASAGHVGNLAAGITYTGSTFPVPISVTTPDATWGGAQWKYDSSFQHKKQTVPPYWGWVTFEQHGHKGAITIMTAYGHTRSVSAVVKSFETRGHGATYAETSAVKLGGFPGVQIDGTVEGAEHAFIPFSPKTNKAAWYPDAYYLNKGEAFRIDVIGVHGKTIVVYIENLDLAAAQFPEFLTKADTLLKTLKLGG